MGKVRKKRKLICCRALSHLIEPMIDRIDPHMERVILPIRLHLNQHNLNQSLQEEITRIEETGGDILLGYGLCGRGVEGVSSGKSRLIIPKVDDCVGAILGSKARHKRILDQNAGTFFLEPSWIDTDVDVFAQCLKGLDKIPEEYQQDIVDLALKHYSRLVLIHHKEDKTAMAADRCRSLAKQYGLEFVQLQSDLTLLEDFSKGNIDSDRFIIVEPGDKVPYF